MKNQFLVNRFKILLHNQDFVARFCCKTFCFIFSFLNIFPLKDILLFQYCMRQIIDNFFYLNFVIICLFLFGQHVILHSVYNTTILLSSKYVNTYNAEYNIFTHIQAYLSPSVPPLSKV